LTLFSSKHPSVLRDNGKTYPFRVASPKGLPGQKDRKVKLKGESILLKKKNEKLFKILWKRDQRLSSSIAGSMAYSFIIASTVHLEGYPTWPMILFIK